MNLPLIICLISLIQSRSATKSVQDLTPDTFRTVTSRPDGLTLVMFHTPWCPHCQSAKPPFQKAAEKMAAINESNVFALVNCDDSKNTVLCTGQNIEGYPTIKLFAPNNVTHIFSAESTEENFMKFFADPAHMSDSGHKEDETPDVPMKHTPYLTADNFKSTLLKVPHALVFFYAPWCPHCVESKPGLDSAAKSLSAKDRAIYAVNCEDKNNKKLCDDEKVEGFPTIRYYHLGEMFAEYDDRMETSGYLAYLSKPPKEKVPLVVPETDQSEESQADDEKMQHVKYLVKEDFDKMLKEKKHNVMVMFYIPMCSHCKDAKPVYDKAAEEIQRKNAKHVLAAVNCSDKLNEPLCDKEKISGFPTFINYNKGKRIQEFTDTPITKEKLVSFFGAKVKEEL